MQQDYLYKAVKDNNFVEVQLYCSYKSTNVNWVNTAENGSTSLSLACSKGNMQIVKLLVEKGANVHLLDSRGFTPIHKACYHGNLEIVQYLCMKGAKVEAKSVDGETPFHEACERGHTHVVIYLVALGATVDKKDKYGWRGMHLACANGHLEVIQYLINKGPLLDCKVNDGRTMLHLACESVYRSQESMCEEYAEKVKLGKLSIIRYLIEKGANKDEKCNDGNTPLHTAVSDNNYEAVHMLLSLRANIEARNNNGCSPLHIACEKRYISLVKLLIEKGANLLSKNKYGWTCLRCSGKQEIRELMVELDRKRKSSIEVIDVDEEVQGNSKKLRQGLQYTTSPI